MQNFDITSANAQVVLTCQELFPQGVALEQFGADNALAADALAVAETRMSVDGKLSAGVVYTEVPVTITLEASSPSRTVMETIHAAQRANSKPYVCELTVYLPAIKKTRRFLKGVMTSGNVISSVGKTLQPTTWQFKFERVE